MNEFELSQWRLKMNGLANVCTLLSLVILTVAGLAWVAMEPWPWPAA